MADDRTLAERVEAVQRWLEPFVLSGAARAAEHAKVLRDLQAELPKWQPIETAPRDGTRVIACGWMLDRAVVQYLWGEWYCHETRSSVIPRVWQHLPDLPAPPSEGE